MKITCEGKIYNMFEGATPQNLWNIVRGGREKNSAVLADCEGDIIDFQTPFKGDTAVTWISMDTAEARRAYQRSLILLLAIAVHELYRGRKDVKVEHALGKSLYCEFDDGHVPLQKELDILTKRMKDIIAEGREINRFTVGRTRAEAFLRLKERRKDAELLAGLDIKELSVTQCGDYIDCLIGPLLPDMSYLGDFGLYSYAPGFLLRIPGEGEKADEFEQEEPLFARVFLESQRWSELIGCHTLSDLNRAIDSGEIKNLISIAEALHEKKLAALADEITSIQPKIRLICIAGPSSSGKTTFMSRLLIHMWVNGVHPVVISLDDYFKNREELREDEWEDLSALDVTLFEKTVSNLLEGKEVHLPRFNFITGRKEWREEAVRLGDDQPIIVEGLHALNPKLTYFVPGYQCMHLYLSALTQITINNHNRISTSDTRLLRRMVRDVAGRGHAPEDTLAKWDSVRRGEERNIFYYQHRAERIFNTALIYELPVLKKLARPLLESVGRESGEYAEAQRLLYFLEPFHELGTELIPDNSILREFVGKGR